MLPARLKAIYLSQPFGIGLCLAALFLLLNVFYLQHVQEQKSENVDNLSQTLQEYQLKDSQAQKAASSLPALIKEDFLYGRLLEVALSEFKRSIPEINIQKLRLTEEDFSSGDSESELTSRMGRHHQRISPEKVKVIELSGQVQETQSAEAYSALNKVISAIKATSTCQFSLEKASMDMQNTEVEHKLHAIPLSFTLRLIPKTQMDCLHGYQRREKSGNE